MSKIVEFPNNQKVVNLNLFSGSFKNRKYKLLKKMLPFFVVTPLFFGVMHFGGGFSIDHGNIMRNYSSSYDIEPIVKKKIVYTGKWSKDVGGYSRSVSYYDVLNYSDSEIHNILINEDIDSLKYSLYKSETEEVTDISLQGKLFNDSTIDYVNYDLGKINCYGNADFSDVFYPFLGYFVIQSGTAILYNNWLNSNKRFDKKRKIRKR